MKPYIYTSASVSPIGNWEFAYLPRNGKVHFAGRSSTETLCGRELAHRSTKITLFCHQVRDFESWFCKVCVKKLEEVERERRKG